MRSRFFTFFSVVGLGLACSPEGGAPGDSAGSGAASGAAGSQAGAAGMAGSQGGSAGTAGAGGAASGGAGGAGAGGGSGSGGVGGTGGGAGGAGSGAVGGAGSGGAGSGGAGSGGADTGGDGGSAGSGGSGDCTPGSGTEDIGTSSVRDKATCLVWQKTASSKNTNKQALKLCDDLSQDGFDDWRVPTTSELVSWPLLVEAGDAYITAPTYIPTTSTSDEEGCIGNCHSCNITKYSAAASGCAWQGVAFQGPTVCVRGSAAPGTLPSGFEPNGCGPCAGKTDSEFKQVDCLPYAEP